MLVVPVRRSSRCVTVRAPLPACRVTWKVPSRAPSGAQAVAPMARATESWVEETTVVDSTVTPAPKAALAPGWKFVPVTVTVRLVPWTPELGATLPLVGESGRGAGGGGAGGA